MSNDITEEDWDKLIQRIALGDCTPLLGAGINHPLLPLGPKIAQDWAEKHDYPLGDTYDLARVAQFLALKGPDKLAPKELIKETFEEKIRGLFEGPKKP